MDQYNKKKKAWEEAQPLMKEAADLNIGNNISIHNNVLIPPHYFTDDTRYGTLITNKEDYFTQFNIAKMWNTLRMLLKECNCKPSEPVTEENGTVRYWCDTLQYRKPTFSVPIAKLMKLLVAQDFSEPLILLSFKVFDQVWFKEFTVAKEIEAEYAKHFA